MLLPLPRARGAVHVPQWELWDDSVLSAATREEVTNIAFYEIVNVSAPRAVFPQTRPKVSESCSAYMRLSFLPADRAAAARGP